MFALQFCRVLCGWSGCVIAVDADYYLADCVDFGVYCVASRLRWVCIMACMELFVDLLFWCLVVFVVWFAVWIVMVGLVVDWGLLICVLLIGFGVWCCL